MKNSFLYKFSKKHLNLLTLSKITKKSNICLYGPPGSGKSAVSQILSKTLKMPVYDVDDDHLEKEWNMTVAEKLELLGDEEFLKQEALSTMKITKTNTIISLTGSNPLNESAINYLRKDGLIVYLDVEKNEILKRCHKMKIDRVVGMSTKSFGDILDFRKEIYDKYYDYRVIVENNDTVEQISDKVINSLNRVENYIDINIDHDDIDNVKIEPGIIFDDMIKTKGDDYIFARIPVFSKGQLERIFNLNDINESFLRILEAFPIGTIRPQVFSKIIKSINQNNNDDDNIKLISKNLLRGLNLPLRGETLYFLDLIDHTFRVMSGLIKNTMKSNDPFKFALKFTGNYYELNAYLLSIQIGLPVFLIILCDNNYYKIIYNILNSKKISDIENKGNNNFEKFDIKMLYRIKNYSDLSDKILLLQNK